MNTDPVLTMHAIDKHFPGVHALDGVDFDVRPGEVHALMGQNGAGKSTLIKVLTGVHPRDGGTITFEKRPFRASSPADAQRKGISTVYQEVNLVPSLSVAENLFLGRARRRWWGIDWGGQRRGAKKLLGDFDLDIDVEETLSSYPVAIQQMVAIARAVDTHARLLIMDEPTSSLDARETSVLFDIIRRLKNRGLGIVFVTHFLDQVYEISDRITVLRNGGLVGTFETRALAKLELVGHMLDRTPQEVAAMESARASTGVMVPRDAGDSAGGTTASPVNDEGGTAVSAVKATILKVRGLGRRNAIEPFDLEIRRGEVLGLAGLLGAGRTEAARLLFGADRVDSGEVEVLQPAGNVRDRARALRVRRMTPRKAIGLGLAYCPEDRKTDGVFGDLSVRENIAMVVQRALSRFGIVSRGAHARIADEFVTRLDIAPPDLDRPARFLSGGNQQKVILARWLACNPALLILDEPTRGIDVGAKAEVEKLIEELSRVGMAIVFISAELDEVVRRSHRVAVLRDRKKVAELTGAEIDEHAIMNIIAGGAAG